jgi:hypothetical protein
MNPHIWCSQKRVREIPELPLSTTLAISEWIMDSCKTFCNALITNPVIHIFNIACSDTAFFSQTAKPGVLSENAREREQVV